MKMTKKKLKEKYQVEIIPMVNVPCLTDYGRYKTLSISRTLIKGLDYLVCNFRKDEFNTYFEMWDEQGFIGNYSVSNENMSKCLTKCLAD